MIHFILNSKYYLLLLILCIGILFTSCNTKSGDNKVVTHTEPEDPTDETIHNWNDIDPGLNGTVVSIDIKHPRSVKPEFEMKNDISLTGWKGERLSAQVLLWNKAVTEGVEYTFSDFNSDKGTLQSDIAKARFVRYTMSEEENFICRIREKENEFGLVLMPDLLDSLYIFDMAAKHVRPIWITIDIPSSASSGIYEGIFTIKSCSGDILEFPISLNVQNRTLPPASEWTYHLDLWQHPSAVARYSGLELWSDAHFEKMKPIMQMLANAGQKVITANINKDPWNNQCYDAYENMIIWTKNEDNSWTYDYSAFDKWVSFMIDLGINKMINCYSMLPWNNEIEYYDASLDSIITVVADPETEKFTELWKPFLTDFTIHLKEKGWLEITNIAMDERSPEAMSEAVALLEKVAPKLGISLADNHKSYHNYPMIKDITVKVNAKVDEKDIVFRRQHELITTYYVCCSDPFPNMFTFSPSAESCYAAWYSYAAGYDGMLRWAYNSWPDNPLIDSRFMKFPSGDTYFVYPDGRSSIRFERLIEGIQDVEKIKILKSDFLSINNEKAMANLKEINNTIEKFNVIGKPNKPIEQMLIEGKSIINKLSEE